MAKRHRKLGRQLKREVKTAFKHVLGKRGRKQMARGAKRVAKRTAKTAKKTVRVGKKLGRGLRREGRTMKRFGKQLRREVKGLRKEAKAIAKNILKANPKLRKLLAFAHAKQAKQRTQEQKLSAFAHKVKLQKTAMMRGPKGGSYYIGPGGRKIYGKK